MTARNQVTVSSEPVSPERAKLPLTRAERQAAKIAELANQQANLKREAAERRAARAAAAQSAAGA